MFSSLSRIDLVLERQPTGQQVYVQTDHRTAQETLQDEEISTLFALTRVLGPRFSAEGDGSGPTVCYTAMHLPPDSLQAAIAAAGGMLEVDDQPVPYQGTVSDPADLADRAFRDLAHRVATRRGEDLDEELLVRLEQEAREQKPDAEEDEIAYWTWVMELAAVTGELLRLAIGGRWIKSPQLMSTVPFAFEGRNGNIANVPGKAERFLAHGPRDSLRQLLRLAEDAKGSGEQPGPLLMSFKPPDWTLRERCVCRHLLDSSFATEQGMPVLVYGRDTPSSFQMFSLESSPVQDVEELHRQAVQNLQDVTVDIEEVDLGGLKVLFASGSYYAAEKVLDPVFMRQMHDRLGAELIAAGIPRKGVLMLTDAGTTPRLMGAFIHLLGLQFAEETESDPIYPAPFLVHAGLVQGLIRVESSAPSDGPSGPSPTGGKPTLTGQPPLQGAAPPFPGTAPFLGPAYPPNAPGALVTPGPLPPFAYPPNAPGASVTPGPLPPIAYPLNAPGAPVTPGPLPPLAYPPNAPGASVTPGPLPPIAVDFAMPPMLWISRAAAVLAQSGLPLELVVQVSDGKATVMLPAVCQVGPERWAPYFEPGPWHAEAVQRLLHTLAVVRSSPHADLRLQVYSRFPPPPWMLDCLRGGPLRAPLPPSGTTPAWVWLVIFIGMFFLINFLGRTIAGWSAPPPAAEAMRTSRPIPATTAHPAPTRSPSPVPAPGTAVPRTPADTLAPGAPRGTVVSAPVTPRQSSPGTITQARPLAAARETPRVATRQAPPGSIPQAPPVAAPQPPRPATGAQAPSISVADDPTRLTPGHRRDMAEMLRGKRVPRECWPREVAPPGIEGAWAVNGFDGNLPTGLQTTFHRTDTIGVSVLLRRVHRGQRVKLLLYRDGVSLPLGGNTETIRTNDGVGYLRLEIPSSVKSVPASYRVDIMLDDKPTRSVTFSVLP